MYTSKMYPFVVGKTTVKVAMMHQVEQFAFGVDPELNCSVLQMDYRGGSVALFVLPSPGKMRQLEQALSARTLRKWKRLLKKRWAPVSICWGLRQAMVNIPDEERLQQQPCHHLSCKGAPTAWQAGSSVLCPCVLT